MGVILPRQSEALKEEPGAIWTGHIAGQTSISLKIHLNVQDCVYSVVIKAKDGNRTVYN